MAAPESVAFDDTDLLSILVSVILSPQYAPPRVFSYGEDLWLRFCAELNVDFGPCPSGPAPEKAALVASLLVLAWTDLLSRVPLGSGAIPLDRALLPVGLAPETIRAWNASGERLGLAPAECRALLEAFQWTIGDAAPNVGDVVRLPRNVSLIRLGALHLVRDAPTE